MGTAGNDDEPVTPPISTIDDGIGESSFNKTVDEGAGSTCEDDANDRKRWVNVESTVEATNGDRDGLEAAIESALEWANSECDFSNGRARDPDGTFFWEPLETCAPEVASTVWPLGSSLFATAASRRHAFAGFEILSELGHGGMGIVYKARQLRLKRPVALKVIRHDRNCSPEDLARLETEAIVLARLNHPNILRIYEIGTADSVPFVALELLEGGTLKAKLAGNPQPVREAATLLSTLARAVHAAHAAGVLHRDLKPSNVLFDSDGVPKIGDFGLAKQLDVEEGETLTGQVLGTPSYMAPEQARGWDNEIGAAADIYSLGAILYEMLTGRPPIKGTSVTETLKLILEEDPVSPSCLRPKLPFDLETICLKCIARDPRKRYPDAKLLAEDLDRFLAGEPILGRRTPLWERALKRVQRHPVISVMLAMGILASSAGSAAFLRARTLETKRIDAKVQELEKAIFGLQREVSAKHWDDVLRVVPVVLKEIELESNDRFSQLEKQAKSLQQQAESGHKEQAAMESAKAAMEKAKSQILAFRNHRDTAMFLDTRFDGLTPADSIESTCKFARAGLGVFGHGAANDEWTLPPLPSELLANERDDVAEGFYELLLVLADAVSKSPVAKPAERAGLALRIIDQARAIRPQPTRAFHLRRSDYLLMKGDSAGAAIERQTAHKMAPAGAFDFFEIGRDFLRKRDWKSAIANLETATQRQGGHFWAKCLLAISYLQNKEPGKARLGLDACIEQNPDPVWLYLLRGIANASEGKLARDLAQLYAGPSASLSAYATAKFEAAEADYREAQHRLASSTADDDLYYVLLVNRGHVRLARNDLLSAAADLQEAICRNPERYEAFSGLANVFERQNKTHEAVAQIAKAIELQPASAQLHRACADLILGLARASADLRDVDLGVLGQRIRDLPTDRRDRALSELDAAIEYESPGTEAIAYDVTKQAALLHAAGRRTEALEACNSALEVVPSLAFAHQLRINVLLDLKRHDELIPACDRAIRLVLPPSAELHELRGMAKDSVEDHSGAIADYAVSLSIRRDNARVLRRRGWSYLALGAFQPAENDFAETIRLAPGDADAYSGRGLARARLHAREGAAKDAETALGIDPKCSRVALNAARVHAIAAVDAAEEARRTRRPAERIVGHHVDRMVDLVRRSLEHASAKERASLFRDTIPNDPAFQPFKRQLKSLESLRFENR